MIDFFKRLFGQQAAPGGSADPSILGNRLYWRENGPIAYEAHVFAARSPLSQDLLNSGLRWFWESGRYSDEYQPVNIDLPKRRALTEMTSASAAAFEADLQENNSGCPRWFSLFALDPGAGEDILNITVRKDLLTRFSLREEGPLQMALNHEGEADWETVFVSHNPPDLVTRLLAAWNIDRATVVRTFTDRENHGIFEATFDLPQRPV